MEVWTKGQGNFQFNVTLNGEKALYGEERQKFDVCLFLENFWVSEGKLDFEF
jgi:hypothetical protein